MKVFLTHLNFNENRLINKMNIIYSYLCAQKIQKNEKKPERKGNIYPGQVKDELKQRIFILYGNIFLIRLF